MAQYGESFLSRVLDEGSTKPIRQYNVKAQDFSTETERNVYDFIMEYAKHNAGSTPDYRTVVEEVPDFFYREGVTDSYGFLAKQLKSYAAKRDVARLFNGQPDDNGRPTADTVEDMLNNSNGENAIEGLISQLESIKMTNVVSQKVGKDFKKDSDWVINEYERRKAGESYKVWKSHFPFINEKAGGYTSGNTFVIYGKSGRGKSAVTAYEALEFAMQGARVLFWSLEMTTFSVFVRLFTDYSRLTGDIATANINGSNVDVGFNSGDLRNGNLSEEFESKFYDFVRNIDDKLEGTIIVRGVDDDDFYDRSLNALESDMITTEADVVVVDPTYLLDLESNKSRKTGGGMEETSKRLRKIAGTSGATIILTTQAAETDESFDEEGERELKVPDREDVKKSKSLLEDAAMVIAVDSSNTEGRGLMEVKKGRDGGENESAELTYVPYLGIIEQLSNADMAAEIF